MADSVHVRFLTPQKLDATGQVTNLPGWGNLEEEAPSILWGTGTPNGDLSPFDVVNKGSLYMEVNNVDDDTAMWMKVDEANANTDWVEVFVENHDTIDNNDFGTVGTSGFVGLAVEDLETNALSNIFVSQQLMNISDSAVEYVVFHAVAALTITEIGLLWTEATTSTLPTTGKTTVGTAAAGTEVVGSTSFSQSQAVGDYQALSIASGAMAAGKTLFWKLSVQSASAAGICRLVVKYDLDS